MLQFVHTVILFSTVGLCFKYLDFSDRGEKRRPVVDLGQTFQPLIAVISQIIQFVQQYRNKTESDVWKDNKPLETVTPKRPTTSERSAPKDDQKHPPKSVPEVTKSTKEQKEKHSEVVAETPVEQPKVEQPQEEPTEEPNEEPKEEQPKEEQPKEVVAENPSAAENEIVSTEENTPKQIEAGEDAGKDESKHDSDVEEAQKPSIEDTPTQEQEKEESPPMSPIISSPGDEEQNVEDSESSSFKSIVPELEEPLNEEPKLEDVLSENGLDHYTASLLEEEYSVEVLKSMNVNDFNEMFDDLKITDSDDKRKFISTFNILSADHSDDVSDDNDKEGAMSPDVDDIQLDEALDILDSSKPSDE